MDAKNDPLRFVVLTFLFKLQSDIVINFDKVIWWQFNDEKYE